MANGTCPNCNNTFTGRTDKKFCSNICGVQYRYHSDLESSRKRARDIARRDAEKRKTYFREYYVSNREQKLEYAKRYAAENPNIGKRSAHNYRKRHQEERLNYNRDYYSKNPEFGRSRASIRRARSRQSVQHARKDLARLINKSNFYCTYCGIKDMNGHVDHVVPLSRGGSNGIGNLVWSCAPCNLSKSNKFITEWRLHLKKIGTK